MGKTLVTGFGAVACLFAAQPTVAETVRYPANGDPALLISVPTGWTHKAVPRGSYPETFTLNSRHGMDVVSLIVPYPGTAQMYAQQMANVSHLQMLNSKPTQLLGFAGYMFDGNYTTFGVPFTAHFVQAKLDKVHLAVIQTRGPVKGLSAKEGAEAKQILERLRLAPAALSSSGGVNAKKAL